MEERRSDYPQLLQELQSVKRKLDEVLVSMNGNGQPGIKIRLDRVERITTVVVRASALITIGCLGFAGWMVQQAFAKVFR